MTKQEFLTNPLMRIKSLASLEIPSEWIAEAWANNAFRSEVTCSLSRSVSKTGSFCLASNWLKLLSGALAIHDVTALYNEIRDQSRRLEMEWRDEFEQAFASCRSNLPAIKEESKVYYFTDALFWSIATGNTHRAHEIIAKARACNFPLSKCGMPLKYFRQVAIGLDCLAVIPTSEDERTWTPIQLARNLGQEEMERILVSAGAS